MQKKKITMLSIVILMLLSACHSPRQSIGSSADIIAGNKTLYQFKWNLIELQGQPVTTSNNLIPFLILTQGDLNKVYGNTGCNNLTGTFKLATKNSFRFSPLATTRMACADNNWESPFLNAMGQVDKWLIINDELSLSSSNKVVAKFKGAALSK